MVALLLVNGCATMSRAGGDASRRVTASIRHQYARGNYVAGTIHTVLAPFTIAAVMLTDPPREEPAGHGG